MENLVRCWKFVRDFIVPRMDNRSIREILFWYINSQTEIFCFRSFNSSTKTTNWENLWSKLYTRKQIFTSLI